MAAGPQDVVILAMKAHQVAAVATDVPKLFGSETVVIPMQNGIPYWYFHEHGGALAGTQVQSVDPTGEIGTHIPAERVIGCVVYPAAELGLARVGQARGRQPLPCRGTERHDE